MLVMHEKTRNLIEELKIKNSKKKFQKLKYLKSKKTS